MQIYWVYILASKKNGVIYIGVTGNLPQRIFQHKEKSVDGFTKKYNTTLLVYAEEFDNINEAIYREKSIKRWKRLWKIQLIEEQNPEWKDLYGNFL